MKVPVNQSAASEILRTLPLDQAFLFFEDLGKYTGIFAVNLDDFCTTLETIPLKSLIFHLKRGDYERWIREGLHDPHLARHLEKIKKNNSGKNLRKQILQPVKRRLNELHKMSRQNHPIHKRSKRRS